MELSLALRENEYLTKEDKQQIDKQVYRLIEKHGKNALEVNRLVFDSVTALTASEPRISELLEQGMFKRFWGEVTGGNQKLQLEIDRGLARAQYGSQQTLLRLAEQNLMSFELTTAVNNKLNSLIIESENEINKIYSTLITFFKQTRSDIIQLENRIEMLEKNVNLLKWLSTIEYQMFNGVEYSELNKIEKIICIVNDFYNITKGSWMTSDLLLLKAALSEIGLSSKEKISYKEFIEYISQNENLFTKLIHDDIKDLVGIDFTQLPIISGLLKGYLLESQEKYVVNTLKAHLKTHGIYADDIKLRSSIVENYIAETAFININSQVNMFDLILELLLNMKTSEYLIFPKYINEDLDFENMEFKLVKKYAEKGNLKAQYSIGNMYYNGEEVEKDHREAARWYKLSAEQGNAEAQNRLGKMYYNGEGVEKNYKESLKWYEKASEQGCIEAQRNLAEMYYWGTVVDMDYSKAFEWSIQAANQGDAVAQFRLGYMYKNGQGVSKCDAKAADWYKKAVEQGHDIATNNLGICYENGEGVEKDTVKAFELYKKAAEQGNDHGRYNLANMYFYGKGVSVNKDEARKLFEKLAEEGYEAAKEALKRKF